MFRNRCPTSCSHNLIFSLARHTLPSNAPAPTQLRTHTQAGPAIEPPRKTLDGAPTLFANRRVTQRGRTPPAPPVNQKDIPRTVAFGRTTKVDDTVQVSFVESVCCFVFRIQRIIENMDISVTLALAVMTLM